MTRIEEIREAAEQYEQIYKELVTRYSYNPRECFKAGALWADIHRYHGSRATESGSVHERIAAAMADWLKQREQMSVEELRGLYNLLITAYTVVVAEMHNRANL